MRLPAISLPFFERLPLGLRTVRRIKTGSVGMALSSMFVEKLGKVAQEFRRTIDTADVPGIRNLDETCVGEHPRRPGHGRRCRAVPRSRHEQDGTASASTTSRRSYPASISAQPW
jgi:hypothetical protein